MCWISPYILRLNIARKTILKIKLTRITIVKVNIDLHAGRTGTFRQRKSVIETVLGIKSARPDADAGKVCTMIAENGLEVACRVCICVNHSPIFEVHQRAEVGTMVLQSSTPGREGKREKKQGDYHDV